VVSAFTLAKPWQAELARQDELRAWLRELLATNSVAPLH
jgi:hypothetical protein